MQLTELERRTLLDLIDADHDRDRRHFDIGRTTMETWVKQRKLYEGLRSKLVTCPLVDG